MAYTTIDDPSAYFQTAIYSGTGSNQSITNDGNSDLQPDWVWVKCRADDGGAGHRLTDSSRLSSGAPTLTLQTNSTAAEFDDNVASGSAATTAFNSDGFSIGTNGNYNTDGDTYVAWQWKANGGTTTSGGGTDSVSTSAHQANTTAGFSIVTYTGNDTAGATVAHGLGVVPSTIIVKDREQTKNWNIYHKSINGTPEDFTIRLNSTAARIDTVANAWNDTAPTSSVFSIGDGSQVNSDGITYVAYVFTEIQGYSKFGKYKGNGNDDGPFLYTGFKPAMFFRKRTDGANGWNIWDSKRTPFNEMHASLAIHTTAVEDSNTGYNDVDFLSNGIKIHDTGDSHNGDGFNYIYWAWAESPFVSSEGVPTTAR